MEVELTSVRREVSSELGEALSNLLGIEGKSKTVEQIPVSTFFY